MDLVSQLTMSAVLDFLSEHSEGFLTGIFVLVAALITRGGSDKRLKRKRNKASADLQRSCPHVEIESGGGAIQITSLCFRIGVQHLMPCALCGRRFHGAQERSRLDMWRDKPTVLAQQQIVAAREKAEELRWKRDRLGYD